MSYPNSSAIASAQLASSIPQVVEYGDVATLTLIRIVIDPEEKYPVSSLRTVWPKPAETACNSPQEGTATLQRVASRN